MKRMKTVVALLSVLMFCSYSAWAAGPSLEEGKKLFNDPALGGSTNDKSCSSCHADGKGLQKAANLPHIEDRINKCIQGALKGQPLDKNSDAMKSLKMYVESLIKK